MKIQDEKISSTFNAPAIQKQAYDNLPQCIRAVTSFENAAYLIDYSTVVPSNTIHMQFKLEKDSSKIDAAVFSLIAALFIKCDFEVEKLNEEMHSDDFYNVVAVHLGNKFDVDVLRTDANISYLCKLLQTFNQENPKFADNCKYAIREEQLHDEWGDLSLPDREEYDFDYRTYEQEHWDDEPLDSIKLTEKQIVSDLKRDLPYLDLDSDAGLDSLYTTASEEIFKEFTSLLSVDKFSGDVTFEFSLDDIKDCLLLQNIFEEKSRFSLLFDRIDFMYK